MHACHFDRGDLPQFAAKDLTDGAGGKFLHEHEPLRQLELRDVAAHQKILDLVQIDCLSIHRDHEGAGLFAEHLIRHRHHADVLDLGIAQNVVFDFLATDLFAAAIDDVL